MLIARSNRANGPMLIARVFGSASCFELGTSILRRRVRGCRRRRARPRAAPMTVDRQRQLCNYVDVRVELGVELGAPVSGAGTGWRRAWALAAWRAGAATARGAGSRIPSLQPLSIPAGALGRLGAGSPRACHTWQVAHQVAVAKGRPPQRGPAPQERPPHSPHRTQRHHCA